MNPWDALRAEVQERRDTVHALEPGGPGGGAIGEPAFSQCQAFSIALTLIDKHRPTRISGAQEFPCPECGRPATISHATSGSARVTVSHPYIAGINEPRPDCEPLWVDVQAAITNRTEQQQVVEVTIRGEFGELNFKKFGPDRSRISIHERDIEHELIRTAALLDEVRADFGAIVRSHEKAITGSPHPVTGFPR